MPRLSSGETSDSTVFIEFPSSPIFDICISNAFTLLAIIIREKNFYFYSFILFLCDLNRHFYTLIFVLISGEQYRHVNTILETTSTDGEIDNNLIYKNVNTG